MTYIFTMQSTDLLISCSVVIVISALCSSAGEAHKFGAVQRVAIIMKGLWQLALVPVALAASWQQVLQAGSDELSQAYEELANLQPAVDKLRNILTTPVDTFNNVFKPIDDQFEQVAKSEFDDYGMRIKPAPRDLGLDDADYYTGYLDAISQDKHFFFWFFESRNDPKNDPVVLWLNGGPGCSSATGLFFELGPSSINATLQPVHNPYSWTNNASVIFLDQPVGVGYSYTGGEAVKLTAAASKDVYVFLELFFQKFPHLRPNDFHIAGELYAGHYIPQFAVDIIERADRSFNLTSVLIGNGITDYLIQNAYYKPMGCGEGGHEPVLNESTCAQLERDYPKCRALTRLCYNVPTSLTCIPAIVYCETRMFGPFSETGLNPYDIRKKCFDDAGDCYEEQAWIDDYLNLEEVKQAVGANVDIFLGCDEKVFRNFLYSGDEAKPFQQHVATLLENDIPVLIYAGDKDYICNWLGNLAYVEALDYSDHENFASAPLRPWWTGKKKLGGEVKNYKHFTFLRVYDAGHMVPYDQPESALHFFNTWISGDYSFGN